MFEKICGLLAEKFGVDRQMLTADTDIKNDLHADSIDLVELMMDLEEGFGMTIADEDIGSIKTIGELVAYLEKQE